MATDSPCEFCDEFAGGSRNSFAARYTEDLQDRTVIETEHLKVLPSLGHFVKGYLLLVPKRHYCALADTPPEIIQEVDEVKMSLIRQLSPLYGSYVFFEHGARTPGSGGCGIYHAHLHAVPVSANEVSSKLKGQFPHSSINSLFELNDAASDTSYLYYEDSSGHSSLFFPAVLPSQYMRRLIAEAAGIAQWDWRRSGREDAFLATRAEVLSLLSVAHDNR
jgi:diadenosine tetraphosphate (Ap4A) HIT family hydrolase